MVFKVIGNEVYEAIKAELLSGRYPQGSKIDIARMAETLHTSATPVRESLMRLVGEQLVHAIPHIGFFMPRTTDMKLRRLIDWNQYQLLPAIRTAAAMDPPPLVNFVPDRHLDPLLNLEQVFLAIAGIEGNPELKASVSRTNDRLRLARRMTPSTQSQAEAEVELFATCLASGNYSQLEVLLLEYHEQLRLMAPKMVERLEAEANGNQ